MDRIGVSIALVTAMMISSAPASAQVSIGLSIRLAPPPLPVYVQPPLPGPDYLWTPGYWAWDEFGQEYFWVPGTWVRAPRPGLLWTPPWWGWSNGFYAFHAGYWGPHIGFYGGVVYGFGYTGFGYQGGYWNGGHVFYNRTVNNITNVNVSNVYRSNVTVNRVTRVSYNGGPGGVQARPRPEEQQASRDEHIAATGSQQAHFAAAHSDPQSFVSANHGRPPTAATPRPLAGPGAPRSAPRQAVTGPSNPSAVGKATAGSRATAQGQQRPAERPEANRDISDPSPRQQMPRPAQQPDRPEPGYREQPPAGHALDVGMHPAGDHASHQAPPPRPHPAAHQPPHPHPHGKPPAPHPHPPAQHHHDDHH